MAKNENNIGGLWLSTSQNPKAPFAKGEKEAGMVADPPKAEFTDDIPFWC